MAASGPSTSEDADKGRLSWRRFAALLAPALTVVGLLTFGMTEGLMAASFAVSGRSFKLSAAELSGSGMSAYPSVVTDAAGRKHPVVMLSVKSGQVKNMCMSMQVDTPIGTYTMRIAATGQSQAGNMMLATDDTNLGLQFLGIQMNRDAAGLDAVPGGAGPSGAFGMQALSMSARNVRMRSWSLASASLRGEGMRMAVGGSNEECY